MIVSKNTPITELDIWAPRYKDLSHDKKEYVLLLAKYKVDGGQPTIVCEITKARHMRGNKYCILRSEARKYPIDSNSKIDCYIVPLSAFEPLERPEDIKKIVEDIFDE